MEDIYYLVTLRHWSAGLRQNWDIYYTPQIILQQVQILSDQLPMKLLYVTLVHVLLGSIIHLFCFFPNKIKKTKKETGHLFD